ncbi:MAG: hypothetical protein WD424_07745 [Paenibacillaceae bacterium]
MNNASSFRLFAVKTLGALNNESTFLDNDVIGIHDIRHTLD